MNRCILPNGIQRFLSLIVDQALRFNAEKWLHQPLGLS